MVRQVVLPAMLDNPSSYSGRPLLDLSQSGSIYQLTTSIACPIMRNVVRISVNEREKKTRAISKLSSS